MTENKRKESVQDIIEKARKQIAAEKNLSPALRITFDLLINIISLLLERRQPKNSKNSGTPLSADKNRQKEPKEKTEKKPGGQIGHKGTRLEPEENPDYIVQLKVDKNKLPAGNRKDAGIKKRQVFGIKPYSEVTEYQAERLIDEKGEVVIADFPPELVQVAQYGNTVKSEVVYRVSISTHSMRQSGRAVCGSIYYSVK